MGILGRAALALLLCAAPAAANIQVWEKLDAVSETDASSYTTASFTLQPGVVAILGFHSERADEPNQPTIDSHGRTWDVVSSVTYNSVATPLNRLTVFRCSTPFDYTGSTDDAVIDLGGETQLSGAWFVYVITGAPIENNGANAIINVGTNTAASGAAAGLTVTLAAFSSSSNATFLAGALGAGNAISAEGGWTQVSNGLTTEFRTGAFFIQTNDTTPSFGNTSTPARAGIAFEIVDGDPPNPRSLLATGTATDASSYDTASVTIQANVPYLFGVWSAPTGAVESPTVTSDGATWTLEQSRTFFTAATPLRILSVYVGIGAGATDTITIAYGGVQSGIHWALVELEGACPADVIRNNVAVVADSTTTINVDLPIFSRDLSPTIIFAGTSTGTLSAIDANFFTMSDNSTGGLVRSVVLYSPAAQDQSVTTTFSDTAGLVAIGCEICSQLPIADLGGSGRAGGMMMVGN